MVAMLIEVWLYLLQLHQEELSFEELYEAHTTAES